MKHQKILRQLTGLTLPLLFLIACGTPQPTPTTIQPTAIPTPAVETMSNEPDYWPTEGWRTKTPEELGMDSEMLAKMFELIQEENYDIHSVTIIRNGYLVVDATLYPFIQGSKHNIHSCTKGVISALIGIAIEKGYIESVKQPVLSFFPERTVANLDANKEAMTLEHLLMMASGLECRDSYKYRWRGYDQMRQTDDWVQFMLDLPMAEPPGTRFEYCNGASLLLAAIIQETTGMNASAFSEVHLFGPLGISDVAWPSNPQGITIGSGGLRMLPHDMAKIGYLYLNKGRWDCMQIIPPTWVAASTRKHISWVLLDYGYQWWSVDDGIFMARGYGGQSIFVAPEHELVIAITSNLSGTDSGVGHHFLSYEFIIPAVRSSKPLPANPDGIKLLESKIHQVAQPRAEPEPVPPLPEIAQRVTGRTYVLDPNPLGLLSFSLTFQEETEALMNWILSPDEMQMNLEDSQAWSKVEWRVGLDNIYRFTPHLYGIPVGLKGWWNSEKSFVIHSDYTGNTGRGRTQFTFKGDQVTTQLWMNGKLVGTFSGSFEE